MGFFHYLLIGLLTALATGALSRWLRKTKPAALSHDSGLIKPDKLSAYLTVLFGTCMAIAGLVWFIVLWRQQAFSDMVWGGLIFMIGACIAGFMTPSLTNIHDVSWDANGITGPANTFGPTLGLKKTTIAWTDITKRGETVTQYWYVESGDRRRIYWSYLYRGHGELERVIAERCSNLKQD